MRIHGAESTSEKVKSRKIFSRLHSVGRAVRQGSKISTFFLTLSLHLVFGSIVGPAVELFYFSLRFWFFFLFFLFFYVCQFFDLAKTQYVPFVALKTLILLLSCLIVHWLCVWESEKRKNPHRRYSPTNNWSLYFHPFSVVVLTIIISLTKRETIFGLSESLCRRFYSGVYSINFYWSNRKTVTEPNVHNSQ